MRDIELYIDTDSVRDKKEGEKMVLHTELSEQVDETLRKQFIKDELKAQQMRDYIYRFTDKQQSRKMLEEMTELAMSIYTYYDKESSARNHETLLNEIGDVLNTIDFYMHIANITKEEMEDIKRKRLCYAFDKLNN